MSLLGWPQLSSALGSPFSLITLCCDSVSVVCPPPDWPPQSKNPALLISVFLATDSGLPSEVST